jgi:phosphoribosylglycinamide formyltransferase-1
MRAIHAAIQAGQLPAQAQVVISNNSQSDALVFARSMAIPAYHLSLKTEQTAQRLDRRMRDLLLAHEVQLVILSGYMKKLGPQTLSTYQNRILNIHPALLPQYGGQGMYGAQVHAAVLSAGEPETGITIHVIDEHYDQGKILAQCRIPILPADTPERLAFRVKAREGAFFVEVLQHIAEHGLSQALEKPSI